MQRRGAMLAQAANVNRGAVALVGGQPIERINLVQLAHHAVALHLGDNGSRRNRDRERIAMDNLGL